MAHATTSTPKSLILAPWFWGGVTAVVGVIDMWGSRFNVNPDGISYVEMAQHAVAGGPDGFINGYWSPGYPILIAPILRLVGHDWVTAIPAIHLVNLTLFLLAGWLFTRVVRATSTEGFVRFTAPVGTAVYLAIAIKCIGLGLVTPDVAVMLVVLAAAGCCLQLERSLQPWRLAAVLGATLAIGYWLKGIMLPLGAMLLVLLWLLPPRVERARMKIGLAAAVFVVGCLPLVAMVSARVGRITMGEVGRLNYAWEVDGVLPFVGWVGDSTAQFGAPTHPPRVLQAEPQTLEFARPIHATYALWFDPSYWYAGVRAKFDAAGQWRALREGITDFRWLVELVAVVVIGMLMFWFATSRGVRDSDRIRVPLVLALWSGGATMVYALVHVEPRYLAGFILVAVVVMWSGLRRRVPRQRFGVVATLAVVAMLVAATYNMLENTGGFPVSYRPDYLIDGEKLRAAGIARGDPVAMVGDAFEAYSAFAIGSPIIAQVVDSAGFWQLTSAARADLQGRLSGAGVRAILANNIAAGMAAEGWRILARPDLSNLGVLLLRRIE